MSDKKYEFELGISFKTIDEPLAKRLADRLNQQVKTYFYRNHEREQYFKNNFELYTQKFSKDIKIVIVLHREEWGKSEITKAEKIAIQQIIMDENRGIEYVFVVLMDDSKPTWYGGMNYFKFKVDKFDSLVDVILYNFQKIGGEIKEIDTIKQLQIKKELEEKRKIRQNYLSRNTEELIKLCQDEYKLLSEIFTNKMKQLQSLYDSILEIKPLNLSIISHAEVQLNTKNNTPNFRVYMIYVQNSPIVIKSGILYMYAGYQFNWHEFTTPPAKKTYKFTVDENLNSGWEQTDKIDSFYSSQSIVDDLMNILYEFIDNHEKNKNSIPISGSYIITGGNNRNRNNRF